MSTSGPARTGEEARGAEKLSALRTEYYFQERAAPADVGRAKRILEEIGAGLGTVPGDSPWDNQKAIDFMKENTGLSEHNIVAEVDRYIDTRRRPSPIRSAN